MPSGRIQVRTIETALTHVTLTCSRCGQGSAVAWAFPIDLYERQTWAGHRLVCQPCAEDLTAGAAWERARRSRGKALSDQADVNRQIERATVELFLPAYNNQIGRQFQILRMQDRPDALLGDSDGTRLGVEVTIVGYPYNKDEHSSGARNEIAFLLGRIHADNAERQSFNRIIAELNEALARKAQKFAVVTHGYPIVLLARTASPLWSASDFELWRSDIVVPESRFVETWLLTLTDDGAGWRHLIQLA